MTATVSALRPGAPAKLSLEAYAAFCAELAAFPRAIGETLERYGFASLQDAIDLASTVNNNVVEYGVTVTLDDPSSDLRLGQTASVSITVGGKDNVLFVPSSAITKVGNFSTVVVRKDDQDTTTQVATGLVGDNGTEITSGLSEGDVVVLSTSTDGGNGFTFPAGTAPVATRSSGTSCTPRTRASAVVPTCTSSSHETSRSTGSTICTL